jgi:DNA-binding transcriptional ArsR family regulator
LTGDLLVTYYLPMLNEEQIFKALADSSRRLLLDLLFERDGQSLGELEKPLAMSRFGVMKHLRILENAGLVLTRRAGREKHHFLNAVPIRLIHDRWIDKYTASHVAALTELKSTLENTKWKAARKRA